MAGLLASGDPAAGLGLSVGDADGLTTASAGVSVGDAPAAALGLAWDWLCLGAGWRCLGAGLVVWGGGCDIAELTVKLPFILAPWLKHWKVRVIGDPVVLVKVHAELVLFAQLAGQEPESFCNPWGPLMLVQLIESPELIVAELGVQ